MSRSERTPHVDWANVEGELASVASDLSNPVFDSLPHVVEILTDINSDRVLLQLKKQKGNIESLVDDVVKAYHNGFNGALENFSGILQHYSDAQLRLDGLKTSLQDSSARLGAQNQQLCVQWRKNIAMTDALRLMDDIDTIMQLPDRVRELEQGKAWEAAVALLQEGCSKIADLQMISGLSSLCKDMAVRRISLQHLILEEVQSRVYLHARASDPMGDADDDLFYDEMDSSPGISVEIHRRMSMDVNSGGRPLSKTGPRHQRSRSSVRSGSCGRNRETDRFCSRYCSGDKLGLNRGQSGTTSPSMWPSVLATTSEQQHLVEIFEVMSRSDVNATSDMDVIHGGTNTLWMRNSGLGLESQLRHSSSSFSVESRPPQDFGLSDRRMSRDLTDVKRRRPHRSSMDVSGQRDFASPGSNTLKGSEFTCLVQRLVDIAGIEDTKSILRKNMSSRIRQLIHSTLKASALTGHEGSSHTDEQSTACTRRGEFIPFIPSQVAKAVHTLVDTILSACLSVVHNLTHLQQQMIMASSKDNPAMRFIKLQLQERSSSDLHADSSGNIPTSHRSFFSLTSTIGDCDKGAKPAEVVQETELTWVVMMRECEYFLKDLLSSIGGDGQNLGSGIFTSTSEGTTRGGLSFNFDFMLDDLHLAGLPRQEGDGCGAPSSYRPEIIAFLGHEPSPYFVAVVYRSVVQFVDMGNRVIDCVAKSVLHKRSQTKNEASKLRHYLENVVIDSFLPRIRVDIRARCNAILEDEEMFRPQARFNLAYDDDIGQDRPILGAVIGAENLVVEVMGWAANMPVFAQQLASIAEGVISRLLDVLYNASVGSTSTSSVMSGRADIATKMALEPAGALLQDPVRFYVPKRADEFDSRPAMAAINAAGLGSGGQDAELELFQLVTKEKPQGNECVLLDESGDTSYLTQIAALIDTLEYLAQAIKSKFVTATAMNTKTKESSSHNTLRTSNQRTADLSDGLKILLDRCHCLSGRCLRTLRLELYLVLLKNLEMVLQADWLNDDTDSLEPAERLGILTRSINRLEEAVLPYLSKRHRIYVFGAGPSIAARAIRGLLLKIQVMSPVGVDRICKVCNIIQPVLTALGGIGESFETPTQEFDATRKYFGLLNERVDSLIKFARERPTRYSPAEYLGLLEVHIAGRHVTDEHRVLLAKALGREKGRKATIARNILVQKHMSSS